MKSDEPLADFDTSHQRECTNCHRKGFDDGDWQFIGWDDEYEMYICPNCKAESQRDDDVLFMDGELIGKSPIETMSEHLATMERIKKAIALAFGAPPAFFRDRFYQLKMKKPK